MKYNKQPFYRLLKPTTLLLPLLSFACIAFGQSITLATWSGQVLTPTTAANVTAQPIAGDEAGIYNNKGYSPSKFYVGSYGKAPNLSYLEFTIQPNTGFRQTLETISFQISGMDGPITYALRSSLDGFASDIATGTGTINMAPFTTYDTRSHTLGSSFAALTTPVTFRIVKTSADDMVHLYDVRISGSVSSIPLPLHFTFFTARKQAASVVLTIQTDNEVNTDRLEIERSSDGIRFTRIGSLPTGPASANRYVYTDNQPANGANYYRIRQVDKDETFQYSAVVTVSVAGPVSLRLTPNPVATELLVATTAAGEDRNGTLIIRSVSGGTVIVRPVRLSTTPVRIDVSRLTRGVYIAQYLLEGEEITQQFIKQ